jgi:hypothetical protein
VEEVKKHAAKIKEEAQHCLAERQARMNKKSSAVDLLFTIRKGNKREQKTWSAVLVLEDIYADKS